MPLWPVAPGAMYSWMNCSDSLHVCLSVCNFHGAHRDQCGQWQGIHTIWHGVADKHSFQSVLLQNADDILGDLRLSGSCADCSHRHNLHAALYVLKPQRNTLL